MKKISIAILALCCLFAFAACDGGSCTYDVNTRNPVASARVFYPCNISSMSNLHATTLSGGLSNSKENMYWVARPMAEAGVVVLAISASNNSTVNGYENAHREGIDVLKAENNDSRSPVYGKLTGYGVAGYSMGGGASLNIATELGNAIETCVAMAPYNPNVGARHSAATLILTGTSDSVAPAWMGSGAYRGIGSPRAYASVSGAGHLWWMNNSNPGTVDDYIVAWLKYFGEGNTSYGSTIENPSSSLTDVELDAPPLQLQSVGIGCN